MAELTINTADITAAIKKNLEGFNFFFSFFLIVTSAVWSRWVTASPACRACPTPR